MQTGITEEGDGADSQGKRTDGHEWRRRPRQHHGRPGLGQARRRVASATAASSWMAGATRATRVATSTSRPAISAAAPVCPRLPQSQPCSHGGGRGWPGSEFRFNNDGSAYRDPAGIRLHRPIGPAVAHRSSGSTDRNDMMVKLTNGNLDQKYTTAVPVHAAGALLAVPEGQPSRSTTTSVRSSRATTAISKVTTPQRWTFDPPSPSGQRNRAARRPHAAGGTEHPARIRARTRPRDWTLYQVLNYYGPLEGTNTTNLWQMMAGLNGKMPIKDWTWEAYYATGSTKTDAEVPIPSLQRYRQLIAAPNFGVNAQYRRSRPWLRADLHLGPAGIPGIHAFGQLPDRHRDPRAPAHDADAGRVRSQHAGRRIQPARRRGTLCGRCCLSQEYLQVRSRQSGRADHRQPHRTVRLEQHPGRDQREGNLRRGAGSSHREPRPGTGLPLLGLQHGRWREHVQGAVHLEGAGPGDLPRRLPGCDPCAKHGGAVRRRPPGSRAVPERGYLLGGDALGLGQHSLATRTARRCRRLCRAIIGNSTSGFDTQTYNTGVVFNGQLLGPGPNGFTRQTPPFFPLEIEIEKGNPDVDPETAKTWTLGAVITEPFGWDRFTLTLDALSHQGQGHHRAALRNHGLQQLLQLQRHQQPDV